MHDFLPTVQFIVQFLNLLRFCILYTFFFSLLRLFFLLLRFILSAWKWVYIYIIKANTIEKYSQKSRKLLKKISPQFFHLFPFEIDFFRISTWYRFWFPFAFVGAVFRNFFCLSLYVFEVFNSQGLFILLNNKFAKNNASTNYNIFILSLASSTWIAYRIGPFSVRYQFTFELLVVFANFLSNSSESLWSRFRNSFLVFLS